MRVVHFRHTGFSKLSETFIYDHITELERNGMDNHVIAHQRLHVEDRPFKKVHLFTRPGPLHPRQLWGKVLFQLGRADRWEVDRLTLSGELKRLIKGIAPRVIHAHFGNGGYLVAPAAAALRIPLVVSFYGQDISEFPREAAWRGRYRELWDMARAVIVLSEDMKAKARLIGCPDDKLHVVHLARRMSGHLPAPRGRAPRRLVSVGRLVEKKGQEDAIRAFARMCRAHQELSYEIIGEGPLRPRLESLIRDLEVGSQVRLLGALPNAEVLRIMRESDAFVLCSRVSSEGDEEGTPTVLIEAQMLGLPCLSTLHAGIPEMIPAENHWLLAPEGDVGAIAERLQLLIEKPPDALWEMVELGFHHVRQHFDLQTENAKLIRIYQLVAG